MGDFLDRQHAKRSTRANNRETAVLRDKCDPGPLLRAGRARLDDKRLAQSTNGIYYINILNFVSAWLYSGGVDEIALRTLDREEMDPDHVCLKPNTTIRIFYWYLLSGLRAAFGDWEGAVAAQNRAMEYFSGGALTAESKRGFQWLLCANGAALKIQRGMLDGVEERLLALLSAADCALHTVECHSLLGTYYLAAGRPDEARGHLRYVAENGNKLACRAKAERLLSEMEGNGRG